MKKEFPYHNTYYKCNSDFLTDYNNVLTDEMMTTYTRQVLKDGAKFIPSIFEKSIYTDLHGEISTIFYKSENYLIDNIEFNLELFNEEPTENTIKDFYNPELGIGCLTIAVAGYKSDSIPFKILPTAKVSKLVIGGYYKTIPEEFLAENFNIKEVLWNQELKRTYIISSKAFYKCVNLKKVTTKKVQYVDDMAFMQCKYLKSIDLSNCECISHDAFNSCTNLTKVR